MSSGDPHGADEDAGDEPFLQRWSRRKARARVAEAGAPDASQPAEPPATVGAAPPDGNPPAIELPDLDELHEDSDYSAFLTPGVDADLRRRALRKLFNSPKFNAFDGLDTYRDDFTQFPALGAIVTADMRHHLERAAEKLAAAAQRTATDTPPAVAAAAPVDPAPNDEPATPPCRREDNDDDDAPA